MLLRKDNPADQNREALKFLDWALKNGQPQAKGLEYVPLPDALVKDIEAHWSRELSGAWELASH
jgi:phosphate transport system substrate-binding protein